MTFNDTDGQLPLFACLNAIMLNQSMLVGEDTSCRFEAHTVFA